MSAQRPAPWRTEQSPIGSNTWIVSGEKFVASASRAADAALIVDAVNERDRLHGLVRRLAEQLHDAVKLTPYDAIARDLLREAREAIGEDAHG